MNSALRIILLLVLIVVGVGFYLLFRNRDVERPRAEPAVRQNSPPVQPVEGDESESLIATSPAASNIEVQPQSLALTGPGDGCQLVVMRKLPDGTIEDLTRQCSFDLVPRDIAEISSGGYIRAVGPGKLRVLARYEGTVAESVLTVGEQFLPVTDFSLDIVPILTKAGCNSGQCHGAAQGKGGLQLSLFGYDPESDHMAFTRGLEGRRIDPFHPTSSLILLKPTLAMPHGGGLRLRPGSSEEDRLRRWIEAGAPWRDDTRGRLHRLVVEPAERFVKTAPSQDQLQVIAEYEDGTRRDVTRFCLFVSNDPSTVTIDKNGVAKLLRSGQADVVVRYANKLANVRIAAPYNEAADETLARAPSHNFVDEHVHNQLKHMRLPVSGRSTDEEFLRRIYFDLVGHMPDTESREDADLVELFLSDTSPDKRDKLIEKLLKHPHFATFWALRLGDLLQISSATMRGTGSYRIWLAKQVALDKSGKAIGYDALVRSLLLAKGSLTAGQLNSGNAERVYYSAPREVGEIAEQAARRFLGVRLRCARCHDHPLDVWTQDDYYGFASFFGGVRVEAGTEPMAQEVKVVKENSVVHLRTGETPQPRYLGGDVADMTDVEDARTLLVDWLFDEKNPRFSRMAVNWVWAHLMGRGLVEPVDDMRETNPPTNPALLDELAGHFREIGYDLRTLVRTICQSETYQRTSNPLPGNEGDEKFFSHALLKPLTAHQMADAIAQVTGVPNVYGQSLGKGTRAIEINDPNVDDYLLDILGRCDRTGSCEVGALVQPASLKLALHLIIGESINSKLVRQGSLINDMVQYVKETDPASRADVWARQVQTVYTRAYCRQPTEEETKFWLETFASSPDPGEAIEDMMWAILNSHEFVMNH
jgi:hypothetical protein